MVPSTLEELKQWLVKELPKWLQEHPDLRYLLESILAETFVRRDEWQNLTRLLEQLVEGQQELRQTVQAILRQQEEHSRILQEHSRTLQEHTRVLQEHTQAIRELREAQMEHSRLLQEQSRTLQEHTRILQEHSQILQEHTRILQEHSRLLQEHSRLLQEQGQAIRELQEAQAEHTQAIRELREAQAEHTRAIRELREGQVEHSRLLQEQGQAIRELREGQAEHSRLLQEHARAIQRLEARIGALGRRWGMLSEAAFREGMYGLLTPIGFRVERIIERDEEGFVFGRPDQVEVDLLIYNDTVIAAEIRASVSKSDVAIFLRKLAFLEQRLQRPVTRRVIISPWVDDDAAKFAQNEGIEIYAMPDELGTDG